MSTFLDNWLLRRAMSAPRGGGEQYDADSYEQDGLVFQLDAFDKGSDPDAWTDRKGGIALENHGAVFGNGYVYFPRGEFAYLNNANDAVGPLSNYTIEVAFRNGGYTDAIFLLYMQNTEGNYPILGFYYGNIIGANSGSASNITQYFVDSSQGYHIASFAQERACYDGNECQASGSNYFSAQSGGMFVGCRAQGSSYFMDGYIYAIRIYNRRLTVAEMTANQHIDNVRFGMGLNI